MHNLEHLSYLPESFIPNNEVFAKLMEGGIPISEVDSRVMYEMRVMRCRGFWNFIKGKDKWFIDPRHLTGSKEDDIEVRREVAGTKPTLAKAKTIYEFEVLRDVFIHSCNGKKYELVEKDLWVQVDE